MFQPEVILPSQFFATVRRRAPSQIGERQLLTAVLEDAVLCFQKHALDSSPRQRRLFEEAQEWLMHGEDVTEKRESLGLSFEYICEVLDLNPDYLRRGLNLWRERQLARAAGAHGNTDRRTAESD